VRLGPGLLGDTSPFAIIRGINGWGRQGWFCLQLIRMGEGQEPDLKMGVLKAVGGFQAFEKKAAERYKENYGY
ncbi:MAG TPA: NADH:flavin oxidoreductase, partial [Rhodobiaceae bacterium]|nr:NADH:flavin oxidoreductase [Rhodobiaceae bacterium]